MLVGLLLFLRGFVGNLFFQIGKRLLRIGRFLPEAFSLLGDLLVNLRGSLDQRQEHRQHHQDRDQAHRGEPQQDLPAHSLQAGTDSFFSGRFGSGIFRGFEFYLFVIVRWHP